MTGWAGVAVSNFGTMYLANSTFKHNVGTAMGSSFSNEQAGVATVVNCTFSEDASFQGVLANMDTGNLTLINDTIDNTSGSSLAINSGTVTATNTIFGRFCEWNPPVNGGHNIDAGSTCGFGSAKGSKSNTSPMLNALADNGGPTWTETLQDGSPAINAGDPVTCALPTPGGPGGHDQRGYAQFGVCDIGATEYAGLSCGADPCLNPCPLGCDDNNPCTNDICDPATGCSNTFTTDPCDDGNACTTDDVCGSGTCAGTPVDCDDANPCTTDVCDPVNACGNTNNTDMCDDEDGCTTGDICGGGKCSGTPVVCTGGQVCSEDLTPVGGCFTPTVVSGACDEAALDTALAAGGLITFDCGTATITITTTKEISKETAIDGKGQITISGGNTALTVPGSMFLNDPGNSFTVRGLTISDLHEPGISGGGINNFGTLKVVRSTLKNIKTEYTYGSDPYGAGIRNVGTATVLYSTLTNITGWGGAAIYNAGSLVLSRSTLANNVGAGQGSSLLSEVGKAPGDGETHIANCTFGPDNGSNGGTVVITGTSTKGPRTLTNCTLWGITESLNSGDPNSVKLTNSVIWQSCGWNPPIDGGSNINVNAYSDEYHNCGFNSLLGDFGFLDPISPNVLADNGGPTMTMALIEGTAAVKGGKPVACKAALPAGAGGRDQRGYYRHNKCSIGAYEVGGHAP